MVQYFSRFHQMHSPESIYEAHADALRHKVKELSAESESLKEEKTRAEKRADLYKLRFLEYVQLCIV